MEYILSNDMIYAHRLIRTFYIVTRMHEFYKMQIALLREMVYTNTAPCIAQSVDSAKFFIIQNIYRNAVGTMGYL